MTLATPRGLNNSVRTRRRYWSVFSLFAVPILAVAQPIAARTSDQDDKKPAATKDATNPDRQLDKGTENRTNHGRLKPFYDVSFHSVPDSSTVNPSDYLVDQRFWQRKPTLIVVTPVSANVLQPDEGHAEALTESLMRQIAADLGVREVHDKVSQTIAFLRKLSKKSKNGETESSNSTDKSVEQAGAETKNAEPKTDKPAEPNNAPNEQVDKRGLRTVQLVLMPDARPVWNGMSLYDRNAVVDRSLNEYLKKVPVKRQRLLEYLEPDQFRFAAFPGKEAGNQMMDSLGVRRPELQFLLVDRNGEVVGSWTKFTFDAKKISAAYRALSKED